MNIPEPPPLSIVVDEYDHAWQAFVSTDGSGVNLWYPAAPRWGGYSIPAKTWDELQALGAVRVVTHGRTEVAERASDLVAAIERGTGPHRTEAMDALRAVLPVR